MTKRCTKCGEVKDIGEFYERNNYNKSNTIYYQSICKNCSTIAHRPIGSKISKRMLNEKYEVKLAKYKDDPWKCIECGKIIPFNRKKIIIKFCSDACKTSEWRTANPEKIKAIVMKHRPNKNKRVRERMLTDLDFKMRKRLSGRIRQALKGQKSTKMFKTLDIIGCTVYALRQHLESQFELGMSWDNHTFNGWHIDHIRPCASFDLTKPEQQKQCFHYTNLQPLWAEDNLKKGAKYEF